MQHVSSGCQASERQAKRARRQGTPVTPDRVNCRSPPTDAVGARQDQELFAHAGARRRPAARKRGCPKLWPCGCRRRRVLATATLTRYAGRVAGNEDGKGASDAFHVLIPSMPGYGVLRQADENRLGPERTGRAWTEDSATSAAVMIGAGTGNCGGKQRSFSLLLTNQIDQGGVVHTEAAVVFNNEHGRRQILQHMLDISCAHRCLLARSAIVKLRGSFARALRICHMTGRLRPALTST